MENIIIFGANSFAKLMCSYLTDNSNYNVIGFTVNKKYISETTISGYPVYEFENIENIVKPNKCSFIIAIGYSNMNKIREFAFDQIKLKKYKIINYIHESSIILSNDIGEGNIILENVTVGKFSKIGNSNVFWPGTIISHNANIQNFNYFSPNVVLSGNINIANNCMMGSNCTVKNNINIKSFSLIGAGSYISQDTEEHCVYVPPRSIKLENKKSDNFII